MLQATHKIASLESENAQLQSDLAECQLEIERLKNQGQDTLVENSALLPQDFQFHSLVLDKLDKDLEELESRRHTEMISGQQTPSKMSPVSKASPMKDLNILQAELEKEAKRSNGSIQTKTGLEEANEKNDEHMSTGKTAWEQLWESLASLSGFHDPEDMV